MQFKNQQDFFKLDCTTIIHSINSLTCPIEHITAIHKSSLQNVHQKARVYILVLQTCESVENDPDDMYCYNTQGGRDDYYNNVGVGKFMVFAESEALDENDIDQELGDDCKADDCVYLLMCKW
eukprot:343981_1